MKSDAAVTCFRQTREFMQQKGGPHKVQKVIVDGSSYVVEFECPAKKLQYPSTEAVH